MYGVENSPEKINRGWTEGGGWIYFVDSWIRLFVDQRAERLHRQETLMP